MSLIDDVRKAEKHYVYGQYAAIFLSGILFGVIVGIIIW
jgi:hypothetical protein